MKAVKLKAVELLTRGWKLLVVATVLTPVLMPGMPVLIAALVAVVVGWTNWFAPGAAVRRGHGRNEPGEPAGAERPPDDPQGPGGELEGLP